MDSKRIGEFIAFKRKQMSMTQQELADKLNLTNRAVSKWETGEGYPDISILPALAEILCVTVDELLSGAETEPASQRGSAYSISKNTQQAGYLLDHSLLRFSNQYLIGMVIVLLGIIASALSLRLYDHIFLTSLIYALIITLAFLFIGMMYYINITRQLKGTVDKYNAMSGSPKADFAEIVRTRSLIFCAIYMILAAILISVIPLYPLMMPGLYQAFHTVVGHTTGVGRLVVDQNFCIFLCIATYFVLLAVGYRVILRKICGKQKEN